MSITKNSKQKNNFTEYEFNVLVSEVKGTSHFFVVKNKTKTSSQFICKAHLRTRG